MALVLAIEPDLRQAEILKRIVREKVKADVVIVDSRDAAMEAMRTKAPDVVLLSALLSPRDEDELVAHLRTLDNAEHLQTHTIPQLASDGGKGHAGSGGGLLRAFRRKKNAEPAVAGCDPDLFAQEIRVFIEQSEQKRFEIAEGLKYRPAIKPHVAAPQAKVEQEASHASAAATTSWDSPFEWRRSDTSPIPLPPVEAAPAPGTSKPAAPEEGFDLGFDRHLFDPLPEPPGPQPDMSSGDSQPLAAFEGDPAPAPLETPALPPFAAEAADDPQAVATFVPVPIALLESVTPASFDPPGEAPVAAAADADPTDRMDAPELFETFVAPQNSLPESITFEAVPAEAIVSPLATPQEIEAYGRVDLPLEIAPSDAPQDFMFTVVDNDDQPAADDHLATFDIPTPAHTHQIPEFDEPITIECVTDEEPLHTIASHVPDASAVETSGDREIDVNWASDAPAEPALATAGPVDIDLDGLAVALDIDDPAADDEAKPAARRPVNLGPLATWARLERTNADDRRPGSDMREIIERLAVPPHIAGVSYARGVRIRRVRVAGGRDRRRPTDQTGPVILSRRALAATRTSPGASA